MKALPKRKGNAVQVHVILRRVNASMKALPKRKGNANQARKSAGSVAPQ